MAVVQWMCWTLMSAWMHSCVMTAHHFTPLEGMSLGFLRLMLLDKVKARQMCFWMDMLIDLLFLFFMRLTARSIIQLYASAYSYKLCPNRSNTVSYSGQGNYENLVFKNLLITFLGGMQNFCIFT